MLKSVRNTRFAMRLAGAACLLPALLPAQLPTTIRMSSEVSPPGGLVQMKVLLTSPQPILSGTTKADMDGPFFDDIEGIALFSPTGDVAGAAVVNGFSVSTQFTSPNGTFGSSLDYPVMTVAIRVSANAIPGQTVPITLNPLSNWSALTGGLTLELKPGSATVGGSLAITNVVPGGGFLPAGTTVSIQGVGFSPKTQIKCKELKLDTVRFVSSNEIQIRLKTAAFMDGVQILAQNPDKSQVEYFSYLRGVPVGASTDPLLAKTVPVFSTNTAVEVVMYPTVSPINPAFVTGLAIQNPALSASDVRLELYNPDHSVAARARVQLQPGTRMTRTLAEWFGVTPVFGSLVHLVSSQPAQLLGLLGDVPHGTVQPVVLRSLTPGSFRP